MCVKGRRLTFYRKPAFESRKIHEFWILAMFVVRNTLRDLVPVRINRHILQASQSTPLLPRDSSSLLSETNSAVLIPHDTAGDPINMRP